MFRSYRESKLIGIFDKALETDLMPLKDLVHLLCFVQPKLGQSVYRFRLELGLDVQ